MMMNILNFEPSFAVSLPHTHALLMSANLTLHPNVSVVTLHGSRGLAGGYRPDSDVDLSLVVDVLPGPDVERELQEVLDVTLHHWHAPIEADVAVIFDIKNCDLKYFEQTTWNEGICQSGGNDCFGLYNTQKGFHGLVINAGIRVKLMYPCLKIWQRRLDFLHKS